MDTNPIDLPNTRIITVSGRIASGATTLAKKLAYVLRWKRMEGGDIFWEAVRGKLGLDAKDTGLRPDEEDLAFEAMQKEILEKRDHMIVESKLAGFVAKDLKDVFKVLIICVDADGVDQTNIRIDRLVNREHMSIADAKEEVLVREKSDVEKWQRLYAKGDKDWTYWNKDYYNLVVNTYSHDPDDAVQFVLEKVGYKQ
jgi:cytidylate kinase